MRFKTSGGMSQCGHLPQALEATDLRETILSPGEEAKIEGNPFGAQARVNSTILSGISFSAQASGRSTTDLSFLSPLLRKGHLFFWEFRVGSRVSS